MGDVTSQTDADSSAVTVPPTPRTRGGRISGIDLARALAIFGMFAVHIGPTDAQRPIEYLYALPHGRASLLFVLVAGVGCTLMAASPQSTFGQSSLKLLWRSVLLLPAGLLLQELDHGAAVILQDYALLFLVAIAALALPDRWLLGLAVVAAPLGSGAYLWGQLRAPEVFARESIAWSDSLADIAHRLVLSGPYPLITWTAPFLLGMWLGRQDLRDGAVRRRLLVVGLVVAAASIVTSKALVAILGDPGEPTGWDHLAVDAAHSQMPLWVVGSTAVAVAVLGASLLVADVLPRLTRPVVHTGQLALTVYIAHLLALHAAPERLTSDQVAPAVAILAVMTLVSIALSAAWRAVFSRGPLELLLHLPWSRSRRRDA